MTKEPVLDIEGNEVLRGRPGLLRKKSVNF